MKRDWFNSDWFDTEWLHRNPLFPWMTRRQRLVTAWAAVVVAIILLYSVLYNYGMRTLEGHDHSIFRSFQTVVETMTTTGYGADSPWSSPIMNVYMAFMQLTGVVIGFATLRVLVIPLFERAPLDLSDRLTAKDDHVVVAEYRRDSAVLLDELERLGIDYVLIESDVDDAKRLSDDGYQVIHGDPVDDDALDRAMIEDARLLVTDAGDDNVDVTLTALRHNDSIEVVALTNTPEHEAVLRDVGVDRVVAPHALIGRRLGQKTNAWVDAPHPDDAALGDVCLREVVVRRNSPLAGRRIADTTIADHANLTLVAAWLDGELRLPPDSNEFVTPNAVLLVAGPREAIDELHDHAAGVRPPQRHSNVVIAGMGSGGQAARDALSESVDATTIDAEEKPGVDVVGDIRNAETFETADVEEASALVVTVDDDSSALLAVAVVRSLTDDIDVLVRVNDTAKTPSAFDAGADYALSIQRVSARLLAREIRGEDVLAPVNQLRLVRVPAAEFAGQRLGDAQPGPGANCVFVGLQRVDEFLTDENTRIEEGDRLVVAGTDAAIREFEGELA
ncbi:potassium channel family protein [Halorussus litoreus]|uniref:potassium channel family protein n=1 Tax=Halorussus litoreus TaxID=1710536 RepID=UPI001E2A3A4E|nr:NAD-binding protein [Halorussus litoreus]